MKRLFAILIGLSLLIIVCINLQSCDGSECAATDSFMVDEDSDCVDDSEDNCLGLWNQDQFDGDDDGIGDDCETD